MTQSIIQHIYKQSSEGDGLLYSWFFSMHTRVDLLFYGSNTEEELLFVVKRIYGALKRLERMANYYDPDSELSYVNQTAFFSPVFLSKELYSMIAMCLEYNAKTLGCFDVTVHSQFYNKDTIHSVILLPEDSSIRFIKRGITVNLSGFLKGYALETIRSILNECKIRNALINLGNSSVLALGNHPMGRGWKVNDIVLRDKCLTISGNDSLERRHIISPRTGKLVEGVRQVVVETDNGAVGEIFSTALFAADSEQYEALLTMYPFLTIFSDF